MNFHVRCTPGCTTKFFYKKTHEKFANPKKLPTFAIPNRNTGREKRGISSVGRAFEWHSKGQEFDSPMLHKKGPANRLDLFCWSMSLQPPVAARHPPFRGNAGTCCATLAEPGCLRCFDASHLADAPARRLKPPSALRASTARKRPTTTSKSGCQGQNRGPAPTPSRCPGR